MANVIPKEEHCNTISHFTHYILGLVTELQGWVVIWKIEENRKSGDSPEVAFVENGIWEKLVTSKNTEYVETFNFAYHIFNHIFMIKKGKGKNFS